jgi:two-component system, OmpR family, phosphate regulon sensor histidine kinase PhoR
MIIAPLHVVNYYMEYQLSEEIDLVEDNTIDYRHFFQSLLEAVPWPLLIINRSLSVHDYNHDAAQLLEAQEPLQQLKLDQLISDRAILELVQRGIQADSPVEEECIREGTGTFWKVSVKPLTHRSHNTGISQQNITTNQAHHYFAIAIEDLTELRRLERVRRDFIANISHELRTPLASVRLLVETLEDAIDTDPDQAQTFIEKIETEVQNLTELVSEILELSRIESGQVPMRIEPIEAEQLVREVMARMLTLAQRHRVQLHTDIEQGKSLVVADSKQILRVLVNLVHNAIKFTPSGGIVVIGTRLEEGGNTQCFFVRDTGIGIPPEDLPRIFERFYKVNQARSKADFIGGPGGGGSGLGLAIARHVVEAHGGRIKVESVVGQESVFTFALPVAIHVL